MNVYLIGGLISTSIYVYSFYKLGDTCYRKDSTGNKKIQLLPLFTEGFIGPIRTICYAYYYGGIDKGLKTMVLFARPYNPWFVLSIYGTVMYFYQLSRDRLVQKDQ